jgi:hypothetical protein
MTMKTIKALCAALMLACLGTAARADEPKPDAPKPAPAAAPAGVLTEEKLQEMLEMLGYEVRESKSTSGSKIFYVKQSRKGLSYEISISLSSDKNYLWTSVYLADLKPEHEAQAARLKMLLDVNQKVGPTHFYTVEKRVYAAKATGNRGMTAKVLREHVDDFLENVANNEEHWNTAKWTAVVAKPEKGEKAEMK